MIFAALLGLTLFMGQGTHLEPAFPLLFERYSGQNGYEDYVKGGDRLLDETFGVLRDLVSSAKPNYPAGDRRLEIAAQFEGKNRIDLFGLMADQYGKALDFVKAGNLKPSLNPHLVQGTQVRACEFEGFMRLGVLGQAVSYHSFSAGKSSVGTTQWLNSLEFSLRAPAGPTVLLMAGLLNSDRLFDVFETAHYGIALKDLARISDKIAQLQELPLPLAATIKENEKWHIAAVDRILNDPRVVGTSTENMVQDGLDYRPLAAMNAAEKKRFANAMRAAISSRIEAEISQLKGDDKSLLEEPAYQAPVAAGDSPEGLAEKWASDTLVSSTTSLRRRYAILHQRLRLVRLHCAVLEYRWQNAKMPASLTDVAPAESTMDPLTGKPFEYAASKDGTYLLMSKGVPKIGDIDLIHGTPQLKESDLRP